MTLNSKVALVTGGARGQGASHARRFVSAGAKVVITDILDDEGQELAASLGDAAIYLHHDVCSESDWRTVISTIEAIHGKLDILVNNAAIYKSVSIADTSVELFERMMRINQLGTFLGMKMSADLLEKGGDSSIINISSIAGLKGFANAIAYTGTKWAVRGMTKVAAAELAPRNIRVNSVHPGFVNTRMLEENDESVNRAGSEATPLKRLGQPEEITDLVVFLASTQSSYITGAEIAIDGGLIA